MIFIRAIFVTGEHEEPFCDAVMCRVDKKLQRHPDVPQLWRAITPDRPIFRPAGAPNQIRQTTINTVP